jgi:hypothetical protein
VFGAQTEIIRTLNDHLRRDFTLGVAYMTPGVAALGRHTLNHRFADAYQGDHDLAKQKSRIVVCDGGAKPLGRFVVDTQQMF